MTKEKPAVSDNLVPFDGDLLPKYVIATINPIKRTIDFMKVVEYADDGDGALMGREARLPMWLTQEEAEKGLAEASEIWDSTGYKVWHIDDLHIAFASVLGSGELGAQSVTSMITSCQFALRRLADVEKGVENSWTDWLIDVSDNLNKLYSYHAKQERKGD